MKRRPTSSPQNESLNPCDFTAANRKRFKDSFCELLVGLRFTHGLTLTWNRDVGLDRARRDLKSLHARVDRKLFGKQFHKLGQHERSTAMFAFEKMSTNLHCHSLWRVRRDDLMAFARLFPGHSGGPWTDLVPSGTHCVDIIDDQRTVASYVVKEQHMNSDDRTLLWSDEFLS